MFTTGLLLSFSLCLDLGVVNIYLVKKGMERGVLPSFAAGLGSCVGDVAYAFLSVLGAGLLLNIPAFRLTVWILGSGVLFFLAVKMLWNAFRGASFAIDDVRTKTLSLPGEFLKGMGLALSSPTSIIWFATVGGAMIAAADPGSDGGTYGFLAGFFAASVLWSGLLAAIAHFAGRRLRGKLLSIFSGASAVLFAFLAVKLFLDGYQKFVL